MVASRKYDKPARGVSLRQDNTSKRIVITFDDETFDQIQTIATRKQMSFAAVVRQLVEISLEDECVQTYI